MRTAISSFSPFSPTYQKVSNRLSRLKQSQHSQSALKQRPNSAVKTFIDPAPQQIRHNRSRHGLSSIGSDLLDQQIANNEERAAGRRANATGIRKYNQRQLRDVGEGRAGVQLKTQGSMGIQNILSSLDNYSSPWAAYQRDQTNKVKIVREGGKLREDLIPGRIYSKASLKTLPA